MRWILICCFLLASAHDIMSTARPKRGLWSIKNIISSKLFGTDTVVIQLPKIPKNETYQLFRINGYDNIFLKVTRKQKEKEIERPVKVMVEDHVMVSPEIAIIANYLGTATEKETLLALEIAKNLVDSGILKTDREKAAQDVLEAYQDSFSGYMVREPVNVVDVITEERKPIYVDPPVIEAERINIVNHRPVAVYPERYPPMVVASEVNYRPFQTKYFYKQQNEDADITYESYNNRGVIVTRTNKVPIKPHYIALRLADVVSIAANPYLIRSHQQVDNTGISEKKSNELLNVVPIHSYVTQNIPPTTPSHTTPRYMTPSHTTPSREEKPGYVDSNNYNTHLHSFDTFPTKVSESLDVPKFIKESKIPFDIKHHLTNGEIDTSNKYINAKLNFSQNCDNIFTSNPYNDDNYSDGVNDNDQKVDAGDNQITPANFVSRYSYTQLGDEGQTNYTIVRIEDPNLNQTEINLTAPNDDIPLNYVYMPPTSAAIPPPIVNPNKISAPPPLRITNTNDIHDQNNHIRYDEYENFNSDNDNYPKTSVPMILRGDLGQSVATEKAENDMINGQQYLTKNPIVVVAETDEKENNVSAFKGGIKTSSRRPFTGGQNGQNTSKTISAGLYAGGSTVRN